MVDIASGLGRGMEQVISAVESLLFPLFSAVLGGTQDMMFELVLFLVIIFSILYIVVKEIEVFKGSPVVIWIVCISISLIATRFLGQTELINMVLLPYSILGISLSSVLPFLIYFAFVQKFSDSQVARRFLWAFYIVAFIGIWGMRYDEVGDLSWIYMFSALAGLLSLIFDGTIRDIIVSNERKLMNVEGKERHLARLRKDLADLRKNEKHYNPRIFKKLIKDASKRIRRAEKAKI